MARAGRPLLMERPEQEVKPRRMVTSSPRTLREKGFDAPAVARNVEDPGWGNIFVAETDAAAQRLRFRLGGAEEFRERQNAKEVYRSRACP